MASDPKAVIAKSYDATLPIGGLSNRTSYVIAPDGRIILAYSDLKADQHVAQTLASVTQWRAAHPR